MLLSRFESFTGVALTLFVLSLAAEMAAANGTVAIRAKRVHTMAGDAIDGGVILIRDGKIEAVGADLAIPEGAKVIDASERVVTPGLVESNGNIGSEIQQVVSVRGRGREAIESAAPRRGVLCHGCGAMYASRGADRCPHCSRVPGSPQYDASAAKHTFWCGLTETDEHAHPEGDPICLCGHPPRPVAVTDDGAERFAVAIPRDAIWTEQGSEVTPHLLVMDSVNLLSNDWKRLLKGGVTTVYVAPDTSSVISARGAIVKTGGPIEDRVVRRADAVQASMGADPSSRGRFNSLPPGRGLAPSVFTRRPTTRMGVDFVFRKAFYDARRDEQGLAVYGADAPPPEAMGSLREILAGRIPLRIHARQQHDIFEAMHLAREFGAGFTLVEAIEAYRCIPQLKAAEIPVIYGPIFMTPTGWRAQTGEARNARLATPKLLADYGIPFALTACELRDEEGLVRQGMFAVRNGLSMDQALRAITRSAAELLGIGESCGAIRAGADADLVIWSGEPFEPTSCATLVMINGRVVYEEK